MIKEIFATECYTLIDALIFWGMGLAIGLDIGVAIKALKKRK